MVTPLRVCWAAAVLCFLGIPKIAVALFEDEVGQYEWMVQQLGRPTALAYSAESSDRVLVASAGGVIASLQLKDGAIQWRRTSAGSASRNAQENSIRLLRAGARSLVSVTEGGLVQAWKGSNGDLTWQREYSDAVVELLVAGAGAKQNALVIRESEVEARTMAGKHEWSVDANSVLPKAHFRAATAIEGRDEATLCVVAAAKGTPGATIAQIDIATGKVLKKSELPGTVNQGLEDPNSFIVADGNLITLVGETLSSFPLCGQGESDTFELRKVKSSSKEPFKLMPWQRTVGVFAATNGVTTAIFGITPKGLKHLRTFEGVAVVGPVFSVHDDETGQPVAVAIVKEEGIQIQLLDPASGNVQPAINAPGYTAADHGPARLLLVRELSSGEHRTVLTAADHSVVGVRGAKVAWVREEALASINQALFYGGSAPAADRGQRNGGSPGLAAQLGDLPANLGGLVSQPMEILGSLKNWISNIGDKKQKKQRSLGRLMPNARVPTSGDELRSFGADKLVIAVTSAAKVFALEATTSEIVWQRYVGNGENPLPDDTFVCESMPGTSTIRACGMRLRLLPSSSSAYSELLLAMPDAGNQQQFYWMNPQDGKILHQEAARPGATVVSVMPLPHKGSSVFPFVVIDNKRHAYVMPSSHTATDEKEDRLFHFEVDRAAQVVHGYAVGKIDGKPLAPLWNLELGSVGERIVAATSPEHREWEHVPVIIKGDASILYKYINPNMVAVVSADSHHKGNQSSLNLRALDSVTGHVLHQSRIVGGSEPVNIIACDNWVLMHYWNSKKVRFEVTMTELFHRKSDDGPWNILFGGSQGNVTKSAHYLDTPVDLQQTYVFPSGVTALGVTATLKGITPRSVIMALTTDHLFRVSKDILNPRRPYAPGVTSANDREVPIPAQFAPTKEEAIMPYGPLVPFRVTDVLTHTHTMSQVQGIISSPTALESTSLVFSYGLDLFFTPVQTAKAYDVLSPGFNYKLLYLSVTIVVGLFIATSYIAQYKSLQDRWK